MTKRLKENRALLPSKRKYFRGDNQDNTYTNSDKKPDLPNFKKVPEEKLREVKRQIKERAEKERKRERILNVVLFIFGLIIMIAFFRWIN